MSKWQFVECDDWEALFVDGVMVEENHSLHLPRLLTRKDISFPTSFEWYTISVSWMEDVGSFGEGFLFQTIPAKKLRRQR